MAGAWSRWCKAAGYVGPFAKPLPALRRTIEEEAVRDPEAFERRLAATRVEHERAQRATLDAFRRKGPVHMTGRTKKQPKARAT